MEQQRREWSKAPLSKTSATVLKWWLEKARKRRTLMKLVTGTIRNSVQNKCNVCGKTAASGAVMQADIARNGQADPQALDALITRFDIKYEGEPFDAAFAPWPVRFYVLQHNGATQGAVVRFVSSPHNEGFIELGYP